MVMSEKEKINTAYHEGGHAIIGRLVPEHDPVHKVTIILVVEYLGVTQYLPEEDRYSMSRRQLKSQLCSLFGGRIAEELIGGEDAVTTGASNDIGRATQLARNIVTKWGLTDKMGPVLYGEEESQVQVVVTLTIQRILRVRSIKKCEKSSMPLIALLLSYLRTIEISLRL